MTAYRCSYHKLEIDEICEEFNVVLDDGLNDNQVSFLQNKHGLNRRSPLSPNSLHQKGHNSYCCGIAISMILCLIGNSIMFNIFVTAFGILLCVLIIFLVIFDRCMNEKEYQNYIDSLNEVYNDQYVSVIRNQKKQKELLVAGYYIKENQISEIKNLIETYCSNVETIIKAQDLVPGDIVIIKKGDTIPADIRVVECTDNFYVDQSSLTGESEPQKRTANTSQNIAMEADNLVFYGCSCVMGNGKGIVHGIGDDTFMGETVTLEVKTPYIEPTTVVLNEYKLTCSKCLCCVSIIFFLLLILYQYINVINNELNTIIGISWLVIGVIIIIFSASILYLILKFKQNLTTKLVEEGNMRIKSFEAAGMFGSINILCIHCTETQNIFEDADDTWIQNCKDLNVKVIITTHDDTVPDSLPDDGNAVFINGDEIKMDDDTYWDNIFADRMQLKIVENNTVDQPLIDDKNNVNNFVFSRVSSQQKLMIVHELQERGNIVGVIGNEVNDVPSLKKSDVGISFNEFASDAAKKASDIICVSSSNHFNSVIKSIKIGQNANKSYGYKLL